MSQTLPASKPVPDAVPEERRGTASPRRAIWVIAATTLLVLLASLFLVYRADAGVNRTTLGAAPRPVSFVEARAAEYRPARSYVGTLESWVEASVGPQYISAYVETVRVRPGAAVHKGDVLATLNCEHPAASSNAFEMQAKATSARQEAIAREASRTEELLDGGFVSPNELDQKLSSSVAERAQFEAERSRFRAASLGVSDCILRAPFEGEVGTRTLDPGAFVHPGDAIVSVVDRRTIRFTTDVPERDYDDVVPGARVSLRSIATGARRDGTIARRAPRADPATRTVHVEVDVEDAGREIPVGTTAVMTLDVGEPVRAVAIPTTAARVRGEKAHLFVVQSDVAHARDVPVLGEQEGTIFLDPSLPAGSHVVSQGSELLDDGDRVKASPDRLPPATPSAAGARGGGLGRPQ